MNAPSSAPLRPTECRAGRTTAALLEQIGKWECEREKIRAGLIDPETRLAQARAIAGITKRDVVAILNNLANDLAALDAAHLRDFVRAIIARVVMDANLNCRIHYEIPAVSGDKLASPRGFVEIPRLAACTLLSIR